MQACGFSSFILIKLVFLKNFSKCLLQCADEEAGEGVAVFGVAVADALKDDFDALLIMLIGEGFVAFEE